MDLRSDGALSTGDAHGVLDGWEAHTAGEVWRIGFRWEGGLRREDVRCVDGPERRCYVQLNDHLFLRKTDKEFAEQPRRRSRSWPGVRVFNHP